MTYNIAFTGHRPSATNSKLFGLNYNNFLSDPKALKFIDYISEKLLEIAAKHNNDIRVYTGMALGVDQMIAKAAFKAREKGKSTGIKVTVHAAIPCLNHKSKWPIRSQKIYDQILEQCNEKYIVSNTQYNSTCMQKRNEYMVDNCDLLIAIWDGSAGGTGNCVHYAQRKNKKIEIIEPNFFNSKKNDIKEPEYIEL